MTVSKAVVPPQVAIVAVPETTGVHWKTCSGEFAVVAHVPLCALVPPVALSKTPPWGGIKTGALQVAGGTKVAVNVVSRFGVVI